METTFFEWSLFKEKYHLTEIPETVMDCSFFMDLEAGEMFLSEKLAAALVTNRQNIAGKMSIEKAKGYLTEESQIVFDEDVDRLRHEKTMKTDSMLNMILPDSTISVLYLMLKIPGQDCILGIAHLCYELMHEYRKHLDEVIEKLEQAQNINQLILEGSTDYIYQLDIVNNVCTFSPKAVEVLPLENNTFGNAMDRLLSFIVPEDRSVFLESFTPFLTGKSAYHNAEYRVISREGEIIWISCHGKGMHDENGHPVMIAGSLMDITEQKKSEERIQKMLCYDLLTGLKNRYCYEKEMAEYMADPENAGCILCIDIYNFKLFNEIFGHNFGNIILKEFATVLQTYFPANNGIYRLEGDEFLIHLPDDKRDDILAKIAPLQLALDKARVIEGHNIYIDVTIGIAVYPIHGKTPDELLKNADTVLYKMSKYSKEKIMFFQSEKGKDLSKRYALENELRKDIENQYKHFRVVYQPIVKLAPEGNYWHCAEALLRYSNPVFPDVTQEELIETLEVSDLIIPVGRWVLQEAVSECSRWNKTGAEAKVHVNLAAQQLSDAGLLNYITDTLIKYDLKPQNLICELTETSLINNFDAAISSCRDVMNMGVGIALDDFGTGYSSFSYLRDLPISQIKIDKAYVDDLKNDSYNQIIISCLYNLSKSMNLELCVEGIEEKETLDILQGMGVTLIQGFYFERPLEAEVIRKEFALHARKTIL